GSDAALFVSVAQRGMDTYVGRGLEGRGGGFDFLVVVADAEPAARHGLPGVGVVGDRRDQVLLHGVVAGRELVADRGLQQLDAEPVALLVAVALRGLG